MKLYKQIFLMGSFLLSITYSKNALSQNSESAKIDTLFKSVQKINDELTLMKRLKISGYIQPQFQIIDTVGASSFAGGDFVNGSSKYSNRFTMRRGRFKFTYAYNNFEIVVNTDVTEKGLFMRETYGKITDRKLKMFSLTAGLLQNQFGHELLYSSSSRETPERARVFQLLFPTERDLGLFGTLEFPKKSFLNGLKFDVAVMNGVAGVNPEMDSNKDYTGRIHYSKTTKNKKFSFGMGASCYSGGYRIGSIKNYELTTLETGDVGYAYAKDTANYDRIAKRFYYGADVQMSFNWKIGTTTLRGEYVMGEQPGTASSSASPKGVPTSKLYQRNFEGACFYFIQNIGKSKFQIVAKYDWYDPNVKLAGLEIGKLGSNTSNPGDIRYDTYGCGLNYHFDKNVKLMLYYDYVVNEETLVPGYSRDLKDNVYTIRMQFKF